MRRSVFVLAGAIVLALPMMAAAGPHDDCTLCHGVHTGQGPVILTETPNTTTINPKNGKPLGRIGSLCMACHAAEPDGAGYRPVDLAHTHPVDFIPDPKKVQLPAESKGFPGEEEKLTCNGCHNQHPANTNYMYLRWDSDNGQNLPKFCAHCHPKQSKDEIRRAQ